jgi:hypothetical protein
MLGQKENRFAAAEFADDGAADPSVINPTDRKNGDTKPTLFRRVTLYHRRISRQKERFQTLKFTRRGGLANVRVEQ